jgi:hypothetical protein
MRLALAGGLLLILALAAGLPFYGQNAVVKELIADVNRNDAAAFAARIDFPALREFLKADIAANKTGSGALGASVGPELPQIGPVVDYFVQPENVDVLFYQREIWFKDIQPEAFVVERGYALPYGFQVTLGLPKAGGPQTDDIPPEWRGRLKARVTFRLGLKGWHVTEMHIPLFMVPHQPMGAPAVKLYGRPAK